MNDKWGRNFLGTPPQGRADYAFIQHILASMNDENGRCAILLPHGILFRNEEKEVRTNLVKSDLLEAVIGLGPNLFYNAPMEACILFCNKNKDREKKNRITFINAVKEVTRKNAESYLEQHHIEKILHAFHSQEDIEQFKLSISTDDIANNDFDLSIQKYVFIKDAEVEELSISSAMSRWLNSQKEIHVQYNTLIDLLSNDKI